MLSNVSFMFILFVGDSRLVKFFCMMFFMFVFMLFVCIDFSMFVLVYFVARAFDAYVASSIFSRRFVVSVVSMFKFCFCVFLVW